MRKAKKRAHLGKLALFGIAIMAIMINPWRAYRAQDLEIADELRPFVGSTAAEAGRFAEAIRIRSVALGTYSCSDGRTFLRYRDFTWLGTREASVTVLDEYAIGGAHNDGFGIESEAIYFAISCLESGNELRILR